MDFFQKDAAGKLERSK